MAQQPPQSRPDDKPAQPTRPSVYGDQWGSSGKQGGAGTPAPDRPQPISTPAGSTGTPDPANSAPTGDPSSN
jgi:hypothetical protein